MSGEKKKVITVVLHPPEHVAATDDVVEQEADEGPGHVVDRCCRRNDAYRGKEDREVEVLQKFYAEFFV